MIPVAAILAIEVRFPAYTGEKWSTIRAELHVTPVRYYLDLSRMLADEALLAEALRTDPTTTHRLLRQREERANARKARNPR